MQVSEVIRERIDRGSLPPTKPTTVWSGVGDRRSCSACDQVIYTGELRYEFDAPEATFRFHASCYALWQVDLIRRGWLMIT
jgi:hypothetical protein